MGGVKIFDEPEPPPRVPLPVMSRDVAVWRAFLEGHTECCVKHGMARHLASAIIENGPRETP